MTEFKLEFTAIKKKKSFHDRFTAMRSKKFAAS